MVPARTRKPTARRREEIAQALLKLVGERGLAGLTTAVLADEVGVTAGALFRHYPSRNAMLEGAVDRALELLEGTFPDKDLPPLERLMALAGARVRLLGAEAGLAWLLRSEQAHQALPENAVTRLRALVRRSRRTLLAAIEDGAAQGSIRSDVAAEDLLVVVMGTVHALVGMPGVHRGARRRRTGNAAQTLDALRRLLLPPGTAKPARPASPRNTGRHGGSS